MTYRPPALLKEPIPPARQDEFVSTHADWAARRARDLEDQRQYGLAEQCSTLNTPGVRIRAWEKLHRLRMPRDPGHRILGLIATQTGLTAEQVHEEQRIRIAPVGTT